MPRSKTGQFLTRCWPGGRRSPRGRVSWITPSSTDIPLRAFAHSCFFAMSRSFGSSIVPSSRPIRLQYPGSDYHAIPSIDWCIFLGKLSYIMGLALRIGGRGDDLDATRDDCLAHSLERLHDAGLVWPSSFSQRTVVAGRDRELGTCLLRILFYGTGQSSRVSGHVRVSTQDAPGDHYANGLHCLRRGVPWRRLQTQTSGRICPPGAGGMGHVSRSL